MDDTIFGGVWNMKIGEKSNNLFRLILTDIYNKNLKILVMVLMKFIGQMLLAE